MAPGTFVAILGVSIIVSILSVFPPVGMCRKIGVWVGRGGVFYMLVNLKAPFLYLVKFFSDTFMAKVCGLVSLGHALFLVNPIFANPTCLNFRGGLAGG